MDFIAGIFVLSILLMLAVAILTFWDSSDRFRSRRPDSEVAARAQRRRMRRQRRIMFLLEVAIALCFLIVLAAVFLAG